MGKEGLKEKGSGSRGLTTLEKSLIFLFVVMTGACIGLVVVYFTEKDDSSSNGSGNASGCGGPQELSGESGTFTSWNYPSSYDNGRGCAWHITVDPDKVIQLWFEEFALEDTKLCTADFITLKDPLGIIGKYCGYAKPKPVVSLGNRLVVYFDTNDRKTDQGFKAHYKAVAPESTSEIAGAGGSLQGDRGDLLTPGFPEQNYQNGVLYQWKITVPDKERVRLTFTSFDLVPEACGDFVQVYDGHKPGSASLGKLCGGKLPGPVESSGNTMVVRFKTDSSLTSKGFSATYTKSSLPPVVIPTTTTTPTSPGVTNVPTTPAPESGCGGPGMLYGRKGEIQSLGFPNPYPAHLHCSWEISVPKGFLVKLHITDLAVTGETGQCKEDKLIVSDNYKTLGTYCGYLLPPVVVSASDTLSVRFQSDSRLTDRGFSAKWEAVYPEDITEIQGCGGSFREETGVIKSQNWPMNYKANAECMWNIAVPVWKRITLKFTHFDVEAKDILSSKCYDNIMVYDIRDSGALIRKYGPFCGSKLPTTIRTAGNRLVMRFQTDLFTEAKGFRAYWTTNANNPAPTEPPVQPNPWDDITIDWPGTCGKPTIPPIVNTRIVNGEPAVPHSWPWQVSMQVWPASRPEPTFFHTCGGTLIHKNWVLTAAHCFINYADELQRWRMCLGKHNLTYTEPSEHCFNVSGIYRHEGFKYPTVPTVEFDIALVRLDGEVKPSQEISYACLPAKEEVLPGGKKCYATGWGDETGDSMNAKVAEALNQVALPVVPYDTCKRADYWWFQVKTSMICCGYTLPDELKSVCQGDSGGPLVCQDNSTTPWEVHGITSFGPIGCIMNKKPSVFTRSSAYIPWIENVIRMDMYNEHTSGCGGAKDLTGTGGTLSSMGYPGSYSNRARCQWNIQVPPGKLVHLHFHNFSLEETQLCVNDKVTLADKTGSLGTYCSHTPPRALVSDGETMHIRFSSNDRVVDTGFSATWKAVDPSEAPCGGSFSGNQGEIISPNWPGDYPAQSVCTWRVTIPSAKNIHIAFTHFEVQAANVLGNCVDYVEIFSGEGMASKGRFCGFAPPPKVAITGNTAVIRFLSNGANQQKGFRGYWTTDASVVPTLPPPPPNPWDDISITWPEACGSPAVAPSNATLRVVNGVEAVPHSWPWQVSMQASPMNPIPYMHGCGGSLIHEEWILTAAHCFMMPLNKPTYWRMCLGKHHMNSSMDVPSAEACYKVDGIIRHEGFVYEQDRTDITNDVALVHLAEPVNMTREISPICLPKSGTVMPAGTPCFVTGWGDEKGNLFPKVSEKLNQAALPIIDFPTCSKPAYWWDTLRPSMICAGYESPDELKSACQGDSGGPFACKAAGTNTTWEVHGVVSFGPQGCIRDKKPSVFTRVSAFNDWILNNMKKFIYESRKPH
ncbi:ovochymase-2 [Polymixia lowei]